MLSHFFESPGRIRAIRCNPSGVLLEALLITCLKADTRRSPLVDTFDQRNTLFIGRAERTCS